MSRSPSSILFALIFCLSLALVVWWTIFQIGASRDMEAAGLCLAAGDLEGIARAFGVADGRGLSDIGHTRFLMFASEGAVFVAVLLVSGWLYVAAVRRESALRAAQDRFLAGATHELKTPLATVSLLLESLRDDRLPAEKRQRYLKMGLLETDRLERGITNVLIAAGLRTAKGRDRKATGDLAEDVMTAVLAMQPRALAAKVELSSQIQGPVPIIRDPEALSIVLHNLLDNAIKYSPPGGAVSIELDADEQQARISVRDPGRGLDANELANAFEPFWRGSDKVTGGTGLGLHLVRELVAAHGGTVEGHSGGRDTGATFIVRLPRQGGSR